MRSCYGLLVTFWYTLGGNPFRTFGESSIQRTGFLEDIIEVTLAAMKDDADAKRDRARMKSACCNPELVGIAGAPEPRAVTR